MPRTFKRRTIPCPYCPRLFSNHGGLNNHLRLHAKPNLELHNAHFHQGTPPDYNENTPPIHENNEDNEAVEEEGQEERMERPQTRVEKITGHPWINGLPCDAEGNFLCPNTPPPPPNNPVTDFSPFTNRGTFELADLLFLREQMSAGIINDLLQIWASTLPDDIEPPFANKQDLYDTIDAVQQGDIPWQSFDVSYNGDLPDAGEAPSWKTTKLTVWYRDPRMLLHTQLGNPDFVNEMDYAPKEVRNSKTDSRRYHDFMSGDWAWRQADTLAQDPNMHGATFCPVILGSDKTTVSVATGQTEYYPVYISNGLVHNNVRCAHRNAVMLLGFLAIPKADNSNKDTLEFRKFRRSVFHASLNKILQPLRPFMEATDLVRFGDGYFRRTVYGLGPYIADYPEQVLLACIVQGWCPRCDAPWNHLDIGPAGRRSHKLTDALIEALDAKTLWDEYGIVSDIMPFTYGFPRADIHELLSPDLLHQIIKGTFKDHIVTWVTEYIKHVHTPTHAKRVLDDIDRRIASAPLFPGLRRFPEGRGFKQWTGDDSKALMKVYLPAIVGHVPSQMVRAISSFMEFCYLVRRSVLEDCDLTAINISVANFHRDRVAFDVLRPEGYSLPRQHSMVHYQLLICEFGAPNGLCSSITESKHIKAVKEPWRRSSRFNALGQMLLTNQRIDKLSAACTEFHARGLLDGSIFDRDLIPKSMLAERTNPNLEIAEINDNEDDDGGAVDGFALGDVQLAKKRIYKIPTNVNSVAEYLAIPRLHDLISRFLYQQENPEAIDDNTLLDTIPLNQCPSFSGKIYVYPSATATFYAPSNPSGTQCMYRERIRATGSWRNGPERRDCVFVERDSDIPGFRGCLVGRVHSFLQITHNNVKYPCALISWFSTIGDQPCPDTHMWKVEPDYDEHGNRTIDLIHLDSILRSAHLMGVHHTYTFLPRTFHYYDTLDSFQAFYVNKFIDSHAHEIAF